MFVFCRDSQRFRAAAAGLSDRTNTAESNENETPATSALAAEDSFALGISLIDVIDVDFHMKRQTGMPTSMNSESDMPSQHQSGLRSECMTAVLSPGDLVYWPSDWWSVCYKNVSKSKLIRFMHVCRHESRNLGVSNGDGEGGGEGDDGGSPQSISDLTVAYSGMNVDSRIAAQYLRDYHAWDNSICNSSADFTKQKSCGLEAVKKKAADHDKASKTKTSTTQAQAQVGTVDTNTESCSLKRKVVSCLQPQPQEVGS